MTASGNPSGTATAPQDTPALLAVSALVGCGLRESHAAQLVHQYGPATCQAAVREAARKKPDNLPGWVCACLSKGWEVGKQKATEDALYRAMPPLRTTQASVDAAVQQFGVGPVREYLHMRLSSYRHEFVPKKPLLDQYQAFLASLETGKR